MAALALVALQGGGAITLSTGQLFVAGLVAAAIDSAFIYPALFKPDPVEGQRFSGQEFGRSEEGAGANRLFGRKVRVAGHTIWASPMLEKEDTETSGKGGSGGEFIRYKYYRHVAIEICRVKRGKTIKGITKVRADGKDFFSASGLTTSSSNKINAEYDEIDTGSSSSQPVITSLKLISDESAGGPNMKLFQSGRPIEISGYTTVHPLAGTMTCTTTGAGAAQNGLGDFEIRVSCTGSALIARNDTLSFTHSGGPQVVTIDGVMSGSAVLPAFRTTGVIGTPQVFNVRIKQALGGIISNGTNLGPASGATNNNGTFKVWKTGKQSSTQSFVTIRHESDGDYPFCAKDGDPAVGANTLTLSQENTSFSKTQAADVRFYSGARNQNADRTIVDVEGVRLGVGNISAYRGRAYMVVEDLELTDFGNRIPNFEFEVEVEEDDRVSTAISEILLDAGMSPGDFDLSGIPDSLKLGGYVIRGPQNLKTALQPIMLAYHLVSQQVGGKLKIFSRTATTLLDVTGKTVAFRAGDSNSSPRPALFTEVGDTKIEQIAVVRYFDPDNDYQIGKKQAEGAVSLSKQLGEFDTTLVMTGTEAQRLVNTLFELGRVTGRHAVKFDLPPSFIGQARESVRVRINTLGQDRQFLLLRVEEGADQILRCEGGEEDLEVFTQTVEGEGTLAL